MLLTTLLKDGVDHIRISPYAKTLLGRISSMGWKKKFLIPGMGLFSSANCFVNWLVTGNEDARHNVSFRVEGKIPHYRQYKAYGKFYQLKAMRTTLVREYSELLFVAYKEDKTGVKTCSAWIESPENTREFVDFIVNNQPNFMYSWNKKYPGLQARIDALAKPILRKCPEGKIIPKNSTPKKKPKVNVI